MTSYPQFDPTTLVLGGKAFIALVSRNGYFGWKTSYVSGEVIKITPSGQVVVRRAHRRLEDGKEMTHHTDMRFDKNNRLMGKSSYSSAQAHLVTREEYEGETDAKYFDDAVRDMLRLLRNGIPDIEKIGARYTRESCKDLAHRLKDTKSFIDEIIAYIG